MGLFFFACCTLWQCRAPENKTQLPNVTGKMSELIVVCKSDVYNNKTADSLKTYFACPYEVLPQPEPLFDLIHVDPNNFNSLLMRHRNILMLEIFTDITDTLMMRKNVWAYPQLVVGIKGKDIASLLASVKQNRERITNAIEQAERKRTVSYYKRNLETDINKKLQQHKIRLTIPFGYSLDVNTNDFIWLSFETQSVLKCIIVYYSPYDSVAVFTKEKLLAQRNAAGKKYIAGRIEGSYMTTDSSNAPVLFREFMLNNEYIGELRGLWKMVNGNYMGGPFVSISRIDHKHKRIITAEAFIYAPNQEKRNMVRQAEAILYALEIIE